MINVLNISNISPLKSSFTSHLVGFPGEYDPAEIHNAGQLRRHMVRNAKMRRNLTNFSLGMKIYLTRFSWPGWCVSAHGLADGELLHVPLLPAGCCYAGTGDNSADTF